MTDHAWASLAEKGSTDPKTYEISYKPRGVDTKGIKNFKIRISSIEFPTIKTSYSAKVTITNDCALTTLTTPSGAPNSIADISVTLPLAVK